MVGEVSIRDAVAAWQARSAPTPAWDEMLGLVAQSDRRGTWRTRVALTDGRSLLTRVTPIARGATLVDFTIAAAPKVQPKATPGPVTRRPADAASTSPLLA